MRRTTSNQENYSNRGQHQPHQRWDDRQDYGRGGGNYDQHEEDDNDDDYRMESRYRDYDDEDYGGNQGYDYNESGRGYGRGHEGGRDYDSQNRGRGYAGEFGDGRDYGYYESQSNYGARGHYGNRNSRGNDYGSQHRGNGGGGRGFASMDREDVRNIAGMGGRAAHQRGTAHEWDSREAREAGRRGGLSRNGNYGNNYDSDYEEGRYGYQSSGRRDDDNDYRDSRSNSQGRSNDYGWDRDLNDYGGRTSRRGFASMSQQERSRISRMGGQASHGGGRSQNGRGNNNRYR